MFFKRINFSKTDMYVLEVQIINFCYPSIKTVKIILFLAYNEYNSYTWLYPTELKKITLSNWWQEFFQKTKYSISVTLWKLLRWMLLNNPVISKDKILAYPQRSHESLFKNVHVRGMTRNLTSFHGEHVLNLRLHDHGIGQWHITELGGHI